MSRFRIVRFVVTGRMSVGSNASTDEEACSQVEFAVREKLRSQPIESVECEVIVPKSSQDAFYGTFLI